MFNVFRLQLIASTLVIFAAGFVSRLRTGCFTGWSKGTLPLCCMDSKDYTAKGLEAPSQTERIGKTAVMGSPIGKGIRKMIASLAILPALFGGPVMPVHADDELARYAAAGNEVGVDGQCFMKKCPVETSKCASDLSCLKGLSCLAR
jgi:hypothetical protein